MPKHKPSKFRPRARDSGGPHETKPAASVSGGAPSFFQEYLPYAVPAALIVAYYFSQHTAFEFPLAIAALASIVFVFGRDMLPSEWTREGVKAAAFETGSAFLVAVAALLFASFALQTATPLDVVTSCSMLPVLERGDFVILQGGGIRVPEVESFSSITSDDVIKKPCSFNLVNGSSIPSLCTVGVKIDNKPFFFNESNDVIVYEPTVNGQPVPPGLIIHRAFVKVKAGGKYYYLTKGDNNPVLDQEAPAPGYRGFDPVPQEKVHGKVLFRVPLLGYFKLFLFLQLAQPPGCDYRIIQKY